MEEYHQITLDEWTRWKEDIRKKLAETAQNFVYIGYRLKQIRDSGMYGGSSDIFEFAQKEYGLGKSTVSRFIAINEKYSEEGNSLELKEQYRGFSSSKLSEMLSLPDSECELITEKTTIKDIRELKSFDRQQPCDVQPAPPEAAAGLTPLQTCIIDYFKDRKEMLGEVLGFIREGDMKAAAMSMNPAECGTHSKGICFLFMYSFDKGIKYKLLMQQEPISMSWEEFLSEQVYPIYGEMIQNDPSGDVHAAFYGGAVATSQQENTEAAQSERQETLIKPESDKDENRQSQELQNSEAVGKNENSENKPFLKNENAENPVSDRPEAHSEKTLNAENPVNTGEEENENSESQETTGAEAVATSQQDEEFMNPPEDKEESPSEDPQPAGLKRDSGDHSDDRFIRKGQMLKRLEELNRAVDLQEWEYALDINKHLGWDIEWMINN